jgi:3'-phosphoadenosine 5'-phosphosulfate sulfotransferase (PAPS reductase)/FAD synthetase
MEALIADINADMNLLKKEIGSIQRKLSRLQKEKDPENIDSHIKAIAGSLHSIYSGYENIIERIVRAVDGDIPSGKDYHLVLLKRALNAIKDVRPSIISIETFRLLEELRTYRHKFRNIYLYLLSAKRIKELANTGIDSFKLFEQDINGFLKFLSSKVE